MAIKYLAGDRLIGTAAERAALTTENVVSATWTTDLSSATGWTNDNTADLEVTGGVIQYKDNDYNYETTYYDMTAIGGITGGISNTAWILRFKWYLTGTASTDDPLFAFSFTEDASQAVTDNGDALGFYIYHDRNNTWRKYFNITKADTTSTRGTASVVDEGFTYSNNTWYWTEIKKDGSTLTIKTFDSADYDTQILDSGNNTASDGTITTIIPAGVGTLRYLTAGHHTQGSGLTVQIDDIQFWDGVSSTSSFVYPNLPNGAIFEESDTGKHYMFDGTSAWNEM